MGSSKSSQWCYSALGLSHVHFVGEIWWTWWWAYCILFWMITLILLFIMVIELNRVQFGLYSYKWLTKLDDCAGVRFVLSRTWLQTKLGDTKFCYVCVSFITAIKFVISLPFLKLKQRIFQDFVGRSKNNTHLSVRLKCTVQLHRHEAYCPIILSN